MSNTRKPTPPATPEAPAIEQALQSTTQAADQLLRLQASYGQERDLVNQLLGQAQMADAISKLTATVAVSKMAFVKENKLYQQLAGSKDRDGRGLTGTWEEFCKLLGTSAPKANEDIINLQTFGEQALESMSSMGIGYRELRQYRRLPDDQKQALIEVAKAGDKEGFVELAEEIITRHAKEKAALTTQIEESQAEREATDKLLRGKSEQLEHLKNERDRFGALPPDKQLADLKVRATTVAATIDGLLLGELRQALLTINNHAQGLGQERGQHNALMVGLVAQVQVQLSALRREFDLPAEVAIPDGQDQLQQPQWEVWANAQQAGSAKPHN